MKVIDLLNLMVIGEDLPKRIRYEDEEYYLTDDEETYIGCNSHSAIGRRHCLEQCLTDEIEIIEEDKEIEFEYIEEYFVPQEFLRDGSGRTKPDKNSKEYKINQLIINQKKLINIINELKKGK